MNNYEFTLKFDLSNSSEDPNTHLNKLYEAGCDDAVIGIGRKGRIALAFNREEKSALKAIRSAYEDVISSIPKAKLIEVTPDFVGVSDIANTLECSRQNIQKIINNYVESFPIPIHEGAQSFWHLATVLDWFLEVQAKKIDCSLLETAKAAMYINVTRESTSLDRKVYDKIAPLFAR